MKKHITYEERLSIDMFLNKGKTIRDIAELMKRPYFTIWHEIKRNSVEGVYEARTAHAKATERRKKAKTPLKLTPEIKTFIEEKMMKSWSFEEISGYMLKQKMDNRVCMKTMYRWHKKKLLLNGEKIYLRRKGKVYKKASLFRWQRGKTIHDRPKVVQRRERIGDWEVDTVLSSRVSKRCIVTAVDRKSRYLLATLVEDRTSEQVKHGLCRLLCKERCLTITSDNGVEFAKFEDVEKTLQIDFYFADSFKSWQRGTNEYANGLLREFFPKKMSFEHITEEQLQEAVYLINHRPCKLFGYKSRFEVYNE
ncbi:MULTISPECIES: IS30 family transposase [unclassified Granulicatella]|uniref:IS30 family transposase n=1 Tax=unclassified Granulicatella TaxID=2630493 RepID=UPI0010742950|nr:IS30 family transposase [Granulicatella sp. WM01]MBF0780664.1 IS30 family transposase [Granulicatella sp. 19428wC4_WM01]TFU94241.1 IS30 family transposase [Granulicatella sp. WM01]